MRAVTLSRIRCGVRIAAGVIAVLTVAYGASVIQAAVRHDEDLDGSAVRWSLAILVIDAGVWVLAEIIAAGFEQVQRTTRERYERLQAEAPTAYAIAAQAVCETYRKLQEQAAEESPKVRVMHR